MKNLPILTVVTALLLAGAWRGAIAWQQPEDATATDQNTSAENTPAESTPGKNRLEGTAAAERARQVLTESRELLFTRPSIRAKLTHTVRLGEFRFRSEGTYRSGGSFRYRLVYDVQLAELKGRFEEVSDGQILHTVRTLSTDADPANNEIEISRRDIQRVKKEIGKFLGNSDAEQSAEIALGGLPSVLASLEHSMEFDYVQEDVLESKPVITLQAKWKAARRTELLGGLGSVAGQIEPFMPDLVRVAFDAETKFPIRIQYLKLTNADQQSYVPMLTMAFSDVVYDELVNFTDFSYFPPQGEPVTDDTAQYIEMIRQSAGGTPIAEPPAS